MDYKKTLNNFVLIKLDPENDSIKLKSGIELYIDTSFEVEKHAQVIGTVYGLPSHLQYCGKANKGMPWQTPMEIRFGDMVIIYYLSVINALKPSNQRYILEGKDKYIFIEYQYVYCVVRDGKILPVNGYCLIEPCSDPSIEADRKRLSALGLELVVTEKRSSNNVTFGIVRYIGTPNRAYADEDHSDEGVDISVGDTVVIRKTNDIPLQYNLHAKIDGGKPYLRVQRKAIFAKL